MSETKLLAEWFLTDRWMGSSGFLLPLEARGLYREMLTQAWRRGAKLPDDPEAIRRACGATVGEWRRCWPTVRKFWEIKGDYIVNETQVEIYEEARARADRASERGASGRRAQLERGLSQAQAQPKPGPPSPSPSGNERTDRQGARPNPFVAGKRVEYEREALQLTAEIAAITGGDGAEIFAQAAHFEGALRQKVNPSNLTDDRLLNTVLDLRATLKAEREKRSGSA